MCSLIFIGIISIVLTSILTVNARVVKVGKFTMMSDAHSRCVSLKHWIFFTVYPSPESLKHIERNYYRTAASLNRYVSFFPTRGCDIVPASTFVSKHYSLILSSFSVIIFLIFSKTVYFT